MIEEYKMPRVHLFGKYKALNKKIYLFLDIETITETSIKKLGIRNPIYVTVLDTAAAIQREEEEIMTTCTHFLSSSYMEKGYDIIILNKDKEISMADLLNNGNSWGRQILPSHNWEKMLYSGNLDIDMSF